MCTKKGRIYDKWMPFNGAPQTFGGQLPQTALPGSATARNHTWIRQLIYDGRGSEYQVFSQIDFFRKIDNHTSNLPPEEISYNTLLILLLT